MMTMSGQQRQKYRNKQQTLDIIRTQTTSIGEVKACWAMKLQLEQNRNWARKCAGHRKHRRVHQKHSTQNELMNDSTNVGLTQKKSRGIYIYIYMYFEREFCNISVCHYKFLYSFPAFNSMILTIQQQRALQPCTKCFSRALCEGYRLRCFHRGLRWGWVG